MSSSSAATVSTTAFLADPTTPAFSDDLEWITAYLTIHSLSVPSRRYSFLLWIGVVLFFLVFAILHWTGSRGGFVGAHWTKWSLRRRTWRKKHNVALARKGNDPRRQPSPLPSNAQLLCLTLLLGGSLALAFIGPDYIAPTLKVWQIRRDIVLAESQRRNFIPDTTPYLPLQPQYTINKAWWTLSARAGQIAFALFPLCVLFALKAPPFAIFAIPFMIQFFFDKLAWLHRWTGRLILFLTSIHVALWSVQLVRDRNSSTGRVAYVYAFSYTPFIFGWIAFALLILIIALSVNPIRRNFYEAFYFLHILLVPLMLVSAAFHHPTLWWWCWGTLAIWAGERIWRWTWWVATNLSILGSSSSRLLTSKRSHSSSDTLEMDHLRRQTPQIESQSFQSPSPLGPYYQSDKQTVSPHSSSTPTRPIPVQSPFSSEANPARSTIHSPSSYIPPPGYAHAELLSGHTVRLCLITPGFLPWAPGQHFLIKIPSVSRFTTHPFTCASICDYASPTEEGRLIVMLIRTRNGWTQDLWDLVSRMTAEQSPGDIPFSAAENLPKHGVLLRAYVDGPFGSSIRARWGNHSTVLIIAGGSGVSFGLAVLQYICMCLSGRDGRNLGGRPGGWGKKSFQTQRVRFVWLIREYSHIQWCASMVRRCISLVPSSALQIDIFVTNFKPIAMKESDMHPLQVPQRPLFTSEPVHFEDLQPPHPSFARSDRPYLRSDSSDSIESHESYESDVDLSYYAGESEDDPIPPEDVGLAHESRILELTNFDGDNDTAMPGERSLSRKLKKESTVRRARSRKVATALAKKEPTGRPNNFGRAADRASDVLRKDYFRYPQFRKGGGLIYQRNTSFASPISMYGDSPTRGRQSTYPESTFSHDGRSTVVRGGTSIYSTNSWEAKSDAGSSRGLLSSSAPDGSLDSIQFDISEEEAQDINVVAEYARPGKPKLERILADEVEQSKGSVVVACCGPTSLNAMVRKIIAAQIDPARVRRGDMRGSITLVSEEFEY
ncbi:ferric reductase like transmembrane component-domain-containing protein [Suillus ampliporus]|nr:ferric reductase like transmembrane component-domain-containing protein [Suillus ampliporus]